MNPHFQQPPNVENTVCVADAAAAAQLLELANTSVSEQMLDLEGSEFNEEFLKALLNNGVDFSTTEHNAVTMNDTPPVTGQAHGSGTISSSDSHPACLPAVGGEMPSYTNSVDPFSAGHLQPAMSSSIAALPKRIIKPRAQPSNEEITKLLLTYISRILETKQNNLQASKTSSSQVSSAAGSVPIASGATGRRNPQTHQANVANNGVPSRNSVSRNTPTSVTNMDISTTYASSSPAKSKRSGSLSRHAHMVTTRSNVPNSKNTAPSNVNEVIPTHHGNSAPIATTSYRTTSRTEPMSAHSDKPSMSHFSLNSLSTHKTGAKQNVRRCKTIEGFTAEPMDCSSSSSSSSSSSDVTITKVTPSRAAIHKKARPYNSLELPKINDPLGLMDQQHVKDRLQPARTATAVEMKVANPEMDLSPLTQILKTVEAVPNLDGTSKVQKKVVNPPSKPSKEDNRHAPSTATTDQVAPINDMLNTVNNMPNPLDIQSVLKYVQKRRAMRKLYKKRSHSTGSIDDLKKENESSASLKAYIELLKAKSQRLQKQSIPDQPANDLQSCMTTQSVVTNDDFEFLRSIGIDPNTVTTDQSTMMSIDDSSQTNGWHSSNVTVPDEPTQLGVESVTTGQSNFVPVHCDNTPFSDSGIGVNGIDTQFPNATNGMDYPSDLYSNDLYDSVMADVSGPNDNPTTSAQTAMYFDASNGMNSVELNRMEEELDDVAFKTTPEIQFAPDWSYTQGSSEVLIHGPFMSSSAQYTCYFGDTPVVGRLQDRGVLSCVCPGHAPGFVPVKVVWGQRLRTCSQLFEYKATPAVSEPENVTVKENDLRTDLLSRIKLLNGCSVAYEITAFMNGNKHILLSHQQFEHLVIYFLEKLKFVANEASLMMPLKPDCRTTILHLAILLDLEKVVRKVKELVSVNAFHESWKSEFSPWTQDDNMCSPLMLSCHLGNVNTSMLLMEWEPDTATLTDVNGVTPVQCALQRGHLSLVTQLENWLGNPKATAHVAVRRRCKAAIWLCRIATIVASQAGPQTTERTEPAIQGPYSANIFPMSSELYATDLEDILQTCGGDILQSNPMNDKESEKDVTPIRDTGTLTPPTPTMEPDTSGVVVNNVEDVDNSLTGTNTADETSGCSPLPMFISSTPLSGSVTNNNLSVSELASGTTHVLDSSVSSSSLFQQPLMGRSQVRNPFQLGSSFAALDSHPRGNIEVATHFSDFRSTSPLLSSPSERSSVLSGSPSSLSIASDCSVTEICEMLGESPSVCQQDFSFPGLSDAEQREIYYAAKTIQHAFRKRKMQAQKLRHSKEKHAAVLIETYYKKYREMKQMNQAAGLIQKYYRRYKNSLARSKELERAALFIQQMYRYQHRMKRMNRSFK